MKNKCANLNDPKCNCIIVGNYFTPTKPVALIWSVSFWFRNENVCFVAKLASNKFCLLICSFIKGYNLWYLCFQIIISFHALNLLFCRLFMKAILKKSCCVVGNYQSLKFIFLVQQRSLPLTFLHLANIRILEFTLIELVIYWDLHYNHHHHQLIPHFKCKIFQYRQNQNFYPNLSYGQLSAKLPVNLCYHFQYWISDDRTDTQTTLTSTGLLCREKIFHFWCLTDPDLIRIFQCYWELKGELIFCGWNKCNRLYSNW